MNWMAEVVWNVMAAVDLIAVDSISFVELNFFNSSNSIINETELSRQLNNQAKTSELREWLPEIN